jgi:hypothetical protein
LKQNKKLKWIGIVVAVFVVLGLAGALGEDEEKKSGDSEPAKEKVAEEKPTLQDRADELDLPVDCFQDKTCVVTKDVGDDIVGIDVDRELLMAQEDIWKNLAEVPGLFRAKVVLEGETTDIAGNSSTSPILSVLCDGKQIRRINWEEVDPDGVKTLCDWQEEVQFD